MVSLVYAVSFYVLVRRLLQFFFLKQVRKRQTLQKNNTQQLDVGDFSPYYKVSFLDFSRGVLYVMSV